MRLLGGELWIATGWIVVLNSYRAPVQRQATSAAPNSCCENGQMKDEPQRQTLRRRSDEPKHEVGDLVEIKDGVFGVVLARFKPSGEKRNEVHYIVELKPEKGLGC